jgi:putative transposase
MWRPQKALRGHRGDGYRRPTRADGHSGVARVGIRLLRLAFSAPPARAVRHAWLTETITAIHTAAHGTYGARRVHAELTLGLGIRVGHGAVELLMRQAGLQGLSGNKRRPPRPETPTAADLVDRKFARPARDQLWDTDLTEHPTREGKVYCAVVLDAHSRRVVSWSIDSTQTARPW